MFAIVIKIIYQNRKTSCHADNTKWKVMVLRNINLKLLLVLLFVNVIKLEDFDFDNVLIDEKSHEKNLFYDVS